MKGYESQVSQKFLQAGQESKDVPFSKVFDMKMCGCGGTADDAAVAQGDAPPPNHLSLQDNILQPDLP